jgi:hypothetical protein
MTTGLTYTTYVSQIATMAVVDSADPAFVTILPQMITYSENRLCRDLDFLFTSTSITGYALTEGNRSLTIPAGTIVVSEQINIITPAGQTNPNAGTRNPCLPATKEYLDAVYGASTYTGLPTLFVYELVPEQLPLAQLVATCGPLAEARPLFRHLAAELARALADVEAQCTFSLAAPLTAESVYVSDAGSRVTLRGVPWGAHSSSRGRCCAGRGGRRRVWR